MKKIKIIVLLVVVLGLSIRCTSKSEVNSEETTAESSASAAEISTIKEVTLNQAQYDAASITLGSFSMKNLTDAIKVNGYTKLPPQNQAEVSTFLTGTINQIHVNEGAFVKKGQVLATAISPEFTRLKEDYHVARSNYNYLKLEFDRQKTLRAEQVNSQKTFEKIQSDLQIEEARVASLRKQLAAANSNGSDASLYLSIVAPISGYISSINVKIGTNTSPGMPLFSIIDNSQLHLDLLVYEKDLPQVQIGQQVVFNLTNVNNSEITGKVFSIGKSFENESKTIAVHASIDNNHKNLIPGMYVNALINVGKNQVQALPKDAIIKADGKSFFFVLEPDTHDETAADHEHAVEYTFQRIEVKTGVTELEYTQVSVLQDFPKEAQIVLSGAYYIQSHLLKNEGGGGGHAH